MTVKITDPATESSGILTAEYEECTGYLVIGGFMTPAEALELATDHFIRLSPDNDDMPPWAYIMHCRNASGEYVRAGEIR